MFWFTGITPLQRSTVFSDLSLHASRSQPRRFMVGLSTRSV